MKAYAIGKEAYTSIIDVPLSRTSEARLERVNSSSNGINFSSVKSCRLESLYNGNSVDLFVRYIVINDVEENVGELLLGCPLKKSLYFCDRQIWGSDRRIN